MLKSNVQEGAHEPFEESRLRRLSAIMGKNYSAAGISLTDADDKRKVPVLTISEDRYSGFHQGAGEIAAAELLAAVYPKYGLVVIDEIETSLHPRAQRRLMRDLATIAREKELQIIVSTHSPFILGELPENARIYIMNTSSGRQIVTGVSPEFAMTKMDEEDHPECDIYVEDQRGAIMLTEIIVSKDRDLISRVCFIPYGTASVGNALGIMADQERFPRPSIVFLDGDQSPATGCNLLPGEDAPERVVFDALQNINWNGISDRIGRGFSETSDVLNRATTLENHHDWVRDAADSLKISGDILWQSLCAAYATQCIESHEADELLEIIRDHLAFG